MWQPPYLLINKIYKIALKRLISGRVNLKWSSRVLFNIQYITHILVFTDKTNKLQYQGINTGNFRNLTKYLLYDLISK